MPSSPGKPVVLMVTSTLPRWAGDSEPRFVLDLCRALAPHYRIVALAPHCAGAATAEVLEGVEVRRFRYAPAALEVLAYEGGMLPRLRRRPLAWLLVPFYMAALVLALAGALRRERPALVHAHWLVPQGLAVRLARVLAGSRVPLVCTAHGADVFGLRGRLAAPLQRWVVAGCGAVGIVSTALGEELRRRGVPQRKLRALPMGITLPPPSAPGSRNPGLVAFAGRLVQKKGVDVLLEAFARLTASHPQARLCIAGGGPGLERYRQQALALGIADCVEFLGPVPQERVAGLFARASVAVMPSVTAPGGDAEGLGLVMLEAMAAECPIVVSDLPVVRDVIRPGQNGLVFPERDAPALAASVQALLDRPQHAAMLAARAREDAAGRYSWGVVAGHHRDAYSELLAPGGSS